MISGNRCFKSPMMYFTISECVMGHLFLLSASRNSAEVLLGGGSPAGGASRPPLRDGQGLCLTVTAAITFPLVPSPGDPRALGSATCFRTGRQNSAYTGRGACKPLRKPGRKGWTARGGLGAQLRDSTLRCVNRCHNAAGVLDPPAAAHPQSAPALRPLPATSAKMAVPGPRETFPLPVFSGLWVRCYLVGKTEGKGGVTRAFSFKTCFNM
ncbi:hypothetical protein H920_05387 [Fukomys damarensis]|uniref:Uncharacterized protein n=1 Tax=Fukomys damarensis TaxID=885580 RepID=A0A091DM77_FUKDA|nr:hypothetical protein H920_05387 [Fukomys damarensis]